MLEISEKTKLSILKSVIADSYQLCELRKSILLNEDFEYLDGDETSIAEVKVNNKIELDDYPTQDKRFGNDRDEEVSALAMKNRKTHEMEIHHQVRIALMNCKNGWDINELLNEIEKYESKIKYTGDGHPYNLDDVVQKIYKDYGEELIKKIKED